MELQTRAQEENKMALDVFSWFFNVTTSVFIVFVNKMLMDPMWGFGFVYATTLCGLHFLTCGVYAKVVEFLGYGKRASMPMNDTVMFVLVSSVSIASLNLSLLVNSVGFYQIAKLMIIPFVCAVEFVWMGRRFTMPVVASIITVIIGVAIVVVTDVSVNALGLMIAAISVVSSGMQQILCGTVQKRHNLTSNQLLSLSAPLQAMVLILVGPFIDHMVSERWVWNYPITTGGSTCLFWSCAIAVLVNVSQFMCLGRFSAVTFQVLGHTKTVLVLICGWLYFGDIIRHRKLAGMMLAVIGMMAYGALQTWQPPKTEEPALPLAAKPTKSNISDAPEEEALLQDAGAAHLIRHTKTSNHAS